MADNALMRGAYSTADINRGLGNVVHAAPTNALMRPNR